MEKLGILIEEGVEQKKKRGLYEFVKRSVDVIGAICGLVVLSPFLLIVSILGNVSNNG